MAHKHMVVLQTCVWFAHTHNSFHAPGHHMAFLRAAFHFVLAPRQRRISSDTVGNRKQSLGKE